MKFAIVSAADATFFNLLLNLVKSVRAQPELRLLDLCVLDVGLTPQQAQTLRPLVNQIATPGWDLEFDHSHCKGWFKAMVARPHLPRLFAEYDVLLWVDADAWVCNWNAVQLLFYTARLHGLAIVPELDRSYKHCYGLRPEVYRNLHATYEEGFGLDVAEKLARLPAINSGVFAMSRAVPYWEIWSQTLRNALQRSQKILIEQCALNVAIYDGRIQPHFLPSWCNWNCGSAVPILNPATRELLAPLLPNEQIGICHLVDVKSRPVNLQCTDGVIRKMPLTFTAVRTLPIEPALVNGK